MAPPTTKEPHLVSRVILRGWTGDDGQLVRYDIRAAKARLLGPDGMGFARNLSLEQAPAFESIWAGFENAWPKARAAVEGEQALRDEGAMVSW